MGGERWRCVTKRMLESISRRARGGKKDKLLVSNDSHGSSSFSECSQCCISPP